MSESIQYSGGPSLQREFSRRLAVRADEENVALAASTTVNSTGIEMLATDEALTYVLVHDGTDGDLTIVLQHADAQAGVYTDVDENGLIRGGENPGDPTGSLVIDTSVAANQGTILIGVCPHGRETDGSGNLVSQLKLSLRLEVTSDGDWDGSEIDVIPLSSVRAHYPGPNAG